MPRGAGLQQLAGAQQQEQLGVGHETWHGGTIAKVPGVHKCVREACREKIGEELTIDNNRSR